MNILSSLQAMQCNCCTTDFDSYAELESHFTECVSRFGIQASGLQEQLSYVCNRCDTTPMSYFAMIIHIIHFASQIFEQFVRIATRLAKPASVPRIN